MSHTPTPWEAVQPSQDTDDVIEIRSTIDGWTVARMGDGDLIDEQDHDNAAHIVRCVNVHDQLVAALYTALDAVEAALMDFHEIGLDMTQYRHARDAVKQALAAAEKGA